MRNAFAAFATLILSFPLAAQSFTPDPQGVQRFGPAYRFPQAGWIVLHVEGAPYDRGFQHGRLLAPEIAGYVRCFAQQQSATAPADGWNNTRTLVNALFLRRYDQEFLEEMKGIADGAAAAGAKFEGRAIELTDIVAINCWMEVETLPGALEATPTGLEKLRFKKPQPEKMPDPPMGHCSAFAATGPATKDGKIVFGHITMFALYPGNFFNVWLDVKPAKGHRVLMQSYPGGIQSGMDYYMNDAGLLVAETTIHQTRFNIQGQVLASRIRKALQYADNIDQIVEHMTKDNNGLYTNEWLIGDVNTNEIAMLQLGTAKYRLSRSSKGEWFGETPGFYWGCNNTKDLEVRLETVADVRGRPANMVWRPSERDRHWLKLYREHQGQIDESFAKLAFTTPPLAAYHSIDAKFTTTDLAKQLKTHAVFGPPLGRTWEPTQHELRTYPEIRPLVPNPWTVLHPDRPAETKANGGKPIDIAEKVGQYSKSLGVAGHPQTVPAWHGTILPKSDADLWLASAFSEFERLVAMENAFRTENNDGDLNNHQRARMALERNRYRTECMATLRPGETFSLAEIKPRFDSADWYARATGRGVLVLHELRRLLTPEVFDKAMDEFGAAHAGKAVSTADFRAHMEKAVKRSLGDFFDTWVTGKEWIEFELADVTLKTSPKHQVSGVVRRKGPTCANVTVTVEMETDEVTSEVKFEGNEAKFKIGTDKAPVRVVVDKYLARARTGPAFSANAFWHDLPRTLIVYGTADEADANRDAAEQMQRLIRASSANHTVPIKSDREIKDDDLKDWHLILIGRPDSNALVQRFADALPVRFGPRSVRVGADLLANARSAVIAAGANPLGSRHGLVVLAGLSAEATREAAMKFPDHTREAADAVALPHGAGATPLLLPTGKLVRELR
jgi:hypothetical protein